MRVLLAGAPLAVGFAAPALADTSNYCGVVATGSGDGKVATGYWYTAENGRRYCRQIVDSANYVCMARR